MRNLSSKIHLFECVRCGTNIYSDIGLTKQRCFFCGEKLRSIAEVEHIPEEIKLKNYKNIDWRTRLGVYLRNFFKERKWKQF